MDRCIDVFKTLSFIQDEISAIFFCKKLHLRDPEYGSVVLLNLSEDSKKTSLTVSFEGKIAIPNSHSAIF